MRTLRGIRAGGAPWVLLALVAAVVVGAVVTAVGDTDGAARTSAYLPLVMLGLVVAPLPATELARRRRDEVSLVRLRGGYGARLLAAVAGLAVVAVLVGALLGLVAAGWLGSGLVGADELAAASVTCTLLAVVAGGSAAVVTREPLAVALRRAVWSGAGTRGELAALCLGLGVLVGTALAIYRARSEAPGALVLAGPVLVGLSAGQLLVWARRLVAGRVVSSGGTVGRLVGLRRALAARQDVPLRLVVASAVVAAAATCAVSATDAWADDTARLAHGGPVRVDLPDASALQALLLTRRLDPDGRWLMAAAVNDERDEARYRVAWLDLSRYDRVSAAHLAGTPGALDGRLDALRAAPAVRLVAGDVLTVATTAPGTVTLDYLDDDGIVTSAVVEVGPDGAGATAVDDCTASCVVLGLSTSAAATVTALTLGDQDLLDQAWDRLELAAGDEARPVSGQVPFPVVVAGTLDFGEEEPEVDGVGGTPRAPERMGDLAGLPLVGGAGVLGDLQVALAATGGSVPAVSTLVLARADTPSDLLDALVAEGGEADAWGPARAALGDRERAEERIGRVTLVAAAALALLTMAAAAVGRRRVLRRERAALRVVGVASASLRAAARTEALVLAAGVLVATAAGGWLAAVTVSDGAAWVRPGAVGLPFGSVLLVPVVLGAAVLAALVVALPTLLAGAGSRELPVTVLTDPRSAR